MKLLRRLATAALWAAFFCVGGITPVRAQVDADGNGGFSTPIPFGTSVGGTGATTAAGARKNLGTAYTLYLTCDGVTDNSAAISAALAANQTVRLDTTGSTGSCVAKGLSVGGANTLDLAGATLNLASGGSSIITLGSAYTLIRNGSLTDTNNVSLHSTTASAASPGAATITVASNTGMVVGSPITVTLACGQNFVTKITTIVGTTIGLADTVPSCATSAVIAAGGSNYVVGDYTTSIGGTGQPVSLKVLTLSGSAVATFSIAGTLSGMFSTVPANPVSFGGTEHTNGSGLQLTITWAGINNGATVKTATPLMLIDGAYNSFVEDVNFNGPFGLLMRDSAASSNGASHTYQGRFSHLNFNTTFGAIFLNDYVNNMRIEDVIAYNGTFGLYIDSRNWATSGFPPSGGNIITDSYFLQAEVDILLEGATLDIFQNVDADSSNFNSNGAGPGNGWVIGNNPASLYLGQALALGDLNGFVYVGTCTGVWVTSAFAGYNHLAANLVAPSCVPQEVVNGNMNARLGGSQVGLTAGTDASNAYLLWSSPSNSYLGVLGNATMNLQANGTTIGSWFNTAFNLSVPLTVTAASAGLINGASATTFSVGGTDPLYMQWNSSSQVYFGVTGNSNLNFQVNGGTVGTLTTTGLNGMPIGATTRSTGAYTTLAANSTVTFSGVTTGTNADFVCMAAGGVLTLQTSACTISSMRFKNLIGDYRAGGALDTVAKLEPIVFSMRPMAEPNKDPNFDKPQIGLSAENVAAIEPRCAIYEDDGVTPKSYRQECLIAVLVAGMRAQQREIEALKAQ